jgi:hypothetical protein
MNPNEKESLTGLQKLKSEIQLNAKNGIDFIFAASVIWFGIFFIWRC